VCTLCQGKTECSNRTTVRVDTAVAPDPQRNLMQEFVVCSACGKQVHEQGLGCYNCRGSSVTQPDWCRVCTCALFARAGIATTEQHSRCQ
jgi:hypothetical protein